ESCERRRLVIVRLRFSLSVDEVLDVGRVVTGGQPTRSRCRRTPLSFQKRMRKAF
ncbi:hypothetical protein THAOC_11539, partial [Thalassiosira oceanica]